MPGHLTGRDENGMWRCNEIAPPAKEDRRTGRSVFEQHVMAIAIRLSPRRCDLHFQAIRIIEVDAITPAPR